MKNSIYKIKYILLLATFFPISGCDDFLEEELQGNLTVESFFKDQADAMTALNGAYSSLSGRGSAGDYYGRALFLVMMNGTNGTLTRRGNGSTQRHATISNFEYGSTYDRFGNLWRSIYKALNEANVIIEKVPLIGDDKIEPSTRDVIMAEAKFLRALNHFNLVALWGGVPLRTSPAAPEGLDIPRSPASDVYDQIYKDLNEAIAALPESHSGSKGRATKGAAQALLARAALQRGAATNAAGGEINQTGGSSADFDLAVDMCNAVLASPAYTWEPDFEKLWGVDENRAEKESNNAIIFSVQFIEGSGNASGTTGLAPRDFLNARTFANQHAQLPFYLSFDENDTRRDVTWISSYRMYKGGVQSDNPTVWSEDPSANKMKTNNGFGPWPAKFIDINALDVQNCGADAIVLRLADVRLMLAEAHFRAGNARSQSVAAMQPVLDRAYGTNPPADRTTSALEGMSEDEFERALYDERRKEMVAESEGQFSMARFFEINKEIVEAVNNCGNCPPEFAADLVKDNRSAIPVNARNGTIMVEDPKHRLFPIPEVAIASNPMIDFTDQNPGY